MIGVFDSGVGGLSVHHALTRKLPRADFIYLADQANTPYGGRNPDEVVALTKAGCIHMFREGASLVVLACNTAAAIALHPLQQDWLPDYRRTLGRPVNVIGLIVPTIEAVTGMGWNSSPGREEVRRGAVEDRPMAVSPHPDPPPAGQGIATTSIIGVFATPATVRSDVYPTEIHKRRPDIRVLQEPCPDLARMIEDGAGMTGLREAVGRHAAHLSAQAGSAPWQAILGCTHYELIADLFTQALPPGTRLIHQPTATAEALVRYLARHPEYTPGQSGLRRFVTTGRRIRSALAENFWGGELIFEMPLAA